MKLRGVISLRNAFPIWAMPNGSFRLVASSTCLKLTKIPCAVSGRRYENDSGSGTGPTWVLNIRLNGRGSVRSVDPQLGHFPEIWSARQRSLHARQSTIGSTKVSSWPE